MANWPQRAAAVRAADGDEWDALDEAYTADWKAAYRAAFRATAAARGWSPENIESGWLDDLPGEALDEFGRAGADPATQTAADVEICEYEAWCADA